MGPGTPDPAFMGYAAGRLDDPPASEPEREPSRAARLLNAHPDLKLVGQANSSSHLWEAWYRGILLRGEKDFDVLLSWLEARDWG